MTSPLHVAVVGAGAFGGWTALALLRRGHRVTLVDAWGAGHSRASSGGETRVIRGLYGADRRYLDWTLRSFALWHAAEAWSGRPLYRETGCLWMFRGDDAYARLSRPHLEAVGLPLESWTRDAAARRWPGVDFRGIEHLWFEPRAGYLRARAACQEVAREVERRGGEVLRAAVRPLAEPPGGELGGLPLANGETLRADRFVLAAGPWLPELLPELLGGLLRPTRQEVFFFGLPAGESELDESHLPVWIDWGERIFYGIPGNDERGFKLGDDTRGAPLDPTTADRQATPAELARARALLAERFPSLADAPLVEARVCQYENTPDGHLIVDRHPTLGNLWIAGGGSGHGFKLAPALGEDLAEAILADRPPGGELALANRPRFTSGGPASQFTTGSRPRFRVLVLCTGNSARSILGEYLLRARNPGRFLTASAGAEPKGTVHPMALRVLRERFDIAADDAWSKRIDQLQGQEFDLVLTVCDHARDACPIWPGTSAVVHWGLPDPAAVAGPEDAVRAAFEATAAELDRRFRHLVELPLESLSRAERVRAVAALAD